MFRKWKEYKQRAQQLREESKQRAQQLRETIAQLQELPPVADTLLVAIIMGSFDSPSSVDEAKEKLAGSFLDVSDHKYALHGRKQFGLVELPCLTLAFRTPTSTFCMLEFIFQKDGRLGMCGIDIKHSDASFFEASVEIDKALQRECAARDFTVPTWQGVVIAFYGSGVEGLWISDLKQKGNTVRLADRAFGKRLQ